MCELPFHLLARYKKNVIVYVTVIKIFLLIRIKIIASVITQNEMGSDQ